MSLSRSSVKFKQSESPTPNAPSRPIIEPLTPTRPSKTTQGNATTSTSITARPHDKLDDDDEMDKGNDSVLTPAERRRRAWTAAATSAPAKAQSATRSTMKKS
ncbi:hypothetical protein J1614_010941 [Plenodomus biglobosus]|nr:hypothetical protein J1614_010941 [Plenodomus biglobosus]